jgi:tetrahydromethanopterin S-methyltransferase subunit G
MSEDNKLKKILTNEKSIKDLIKRTERLSHKVDQLTNIQKHLMTENNTLKKEIAYIKKKELE